MGWLIGEKIGLMTAYFSSCIGSAIGIVLAVLLNRRLFATIDEAENLKNGVDFFTRFKRQGHSFKQEWKIEETSKSTAHNGHPPLHLINFLHREIDHGSRLP